jgi:nucleoside-diphosphate-sugar epimerase
MIENQKRIIIGSEGNLARALKKMYPDASVIPRQQYLSWRNTSDVKKSINCKNIDVFVAIGVLSKDADKENLDLINYKIPTFIADAISDNCSRIITFGTIMERYVNVFTTNRYVESKHRLNLYLQNNISSDNYSHFLIHTLYGGIKANSDMFLGQLFNSVRLHSKFPMSNGLQVREYHHIDDDLSAIKHCLKNNLGGVQEISHGESIRLREIALSVLTHFNLTNFLSIGELETPESEIYEPIGIKNSYLENMFFRPSIAGIISYFEEQLGQSK